MHSSTVVLDFCNAGKNSENMTVKHLAYCRCK